MNQTEETEPKKKTEKRKYMLSHILIHRYPIKTQDQKLEYPCLRVVGGKRGPDKALWDEEPLKMSWSSFCADRLHLEMGS